MIKVRIAVLALGTVLTIFYLVCLHLGAVYDNRIETLPKEGFSDKELFSAGFFLQKFRPFSMDSKTGRKMLAEAALLYPEKEGKYSVYWAKVFHARTITMSLLVLCGVLCFAGTVASPVMFALCIIAALAGAYTMYDSGVKSMEKRLKERSESCIYDFANMVSKLSLLMNCSLTLHDAWKMVASSGNSEIYKLMQVAADEMENSGKDDVVAIYDFGVRCNAPEIRKFAGTLIQNVEKGGSDVTEYLRSQAKELGGQRKQILLRRGDEAAAKLLLPTMMFMGGVILIVLAAASGNMGAAV